MIYLLFTYCYCLCFIFIGSELTSVFIISLTYFELTSLHNNPHSWSINQYNFTFLVIRIILIYLNPGNQNENFPNEHA